jgi:hypothetical protein
MIANAGIYNTKPAVRWILWEIDVSTAVILYSVKIIGGMALSSALFLKNKAIFLSSIVFYLVFGSWVLTDFIRNQNDISRADARRDLALVTTPILILLYYQARKHSSSKRNQELAKIKVRSERTRWWLKCMPLVLILIGVPAAVILPGLVNPYAGYDGSVTGIFFGVLIVLAGLLWFRVSQQMTRLERFGVS